MLSDEWLSRYGLLQNFNASVTRTGTGTHTGTGTWTTGVTAIALCTACSRAKNEYVDFNISSHLGVSHNKVQSLLTVCCSESALFSLDFLLGPFVVLFSFSL